MAKVLLLLALLVSLAHSAVFARLVDAQSHSTNWGSRVPNDVLLRRDVVIMPRRFLRVNSQKYSFRPPTDENTIKSIFVMDNFNNGFDAVLLNGGPGHKFAEIQLTSRRSAGYNFTIDIYGVRN